MKKGIVPLLVFGVGVLLGTPAIVNASSSDIVPIGSPDIDAIASLQQHGTLVATFVSPNHLYTRGELADMVVPVLVNLQSGDPVVSDPVASGYLRALALDLTLELQERGVDVSHALEILPTTTAFGGSVGVEARTGTKNGFDPLYRFNATGHVSSDIEASGTVSNYSIEQRRQFNDDVGHRNQPVISDLQIGIERASGFQLVVGREPLRWGPAYRGATLISDNAPPLDMVKLSFPFSLGAHLGRTYRYTESLGTLTEDDTRKYLGLRRIEFIPNRHLTLEFDEAFKSSRLGSLLSAPLPFNVASLNFSKTLKGISVQSIDHHFNYVLNFGGTYAFDDVNRIYGQFLIDDLKSPFGSRDKVVPRKIAYLVGTTAKVGANGTATIEYSFVDPTTFTYQNHEAEWTNGQYDYLGLPSGPNSRELYLRYDQPIGTKFEVIADARDRRRPSNSFPAPTAKAVGVTLDYLLNRNSTVGVRYQLYQQDPFPFAPGTVNYPVETFTPLDEGNPGARIRSHELDVTYRTGY